MPERIRLFDIRLGEFPAALGFCASDQARIAKAVNTAQRRLLFCKEASDEGWFGTWAEMAFTVAVANPYLTTPREVARLEAITICNRPVPIQNQFFEYLRFGNGRLPKQCQRTCKSPIQAYSRNIVTTINDLSSPPQQIVIFATDPADAGKRVLLQGFDQNNNPIFTQDGLNQVQGVYVTLALPFAVATYQFNSLTGIQKDLTSGQIQIFQQTPNTTTQSLLVTMQPDEQVAGYRRYYLDNLPTIGCCPAIIPPPATVTITALAKLELIPVRVDTDYLLIQNEEAIIEEAQSARYSRIDTTNAKSLSIAHHLDAVRLLNGQLTHYYGKNEPAVNFKPYGSASLERLRVGMQ